MKEQFIFEAPGKVVAGTGALTNIPEIISGMGKKNVVIITDPGIISTGIIDTLKDLLHQHTKDVIVIDDVPREPDIESAELLLQHMRTIPCSILLGIGGGSVLDLTKLFGCMYHGSDTVAAVLKSGVFDCQKIPTCLIPTTAGTGSEATKNVILANPQLRIKEALVHERLLPEYVILDPNLTISLPREITAATGLDALAHALECYISLKATPLSNILALDAMKRIYRSLPIAYSDGSNIQARTDMLLASFYAGMCISLSGTTSVHALSYPLGALYHIPHGNANAMLLAPVMRFNKDCIQEELHAAASCFGVINDNVEQAADEFVDKLYALVKSLKVPVRLSDYGIQKDELPVLAQRALMITRLLSNNPKLMREVDILTIYEKMF